MRNPRLLILAAGLVAAGPIASWADPDSGSGRDYVQIHPYNSNYHDPNDLIAYADPGPGPAVDGEGEHLVAWKQGAVPGVEGRRQGIEPGRPLDPALLNDPDVVKWPTLDKSLWEKHKSAYQIVPRQ